MTRTMAVTVIRGQGNGAEVVVNGLVKQEIERQNATREAEYARSQTIEESRNRLLAEQLAATRRALYRRPPLGKRIRNRIADIWAVCIGTIIVLGEALGLWEYEED